jgi:hypothetical protein
VKDDDDDEGRWKHFFTDLGFGCLVDGCFAAATSLILVVAFPIGLFEAIRIWL